MLISRTNPHVAVALAVLTSCLLGANSAPVQQAAQVDGWQRREVDLRVNGGLRARAVYFPAEKPVPLRGTYSRSSGAKRLSGPATDGVQVGVINSPPLAGFVPYVAIIATDERGEELDGASVPEEWVVGQPFVANPRVDYAIGLYDTGASASVIGYGSANKMGLYAAGQLTSNNVTVTGVTGSVVCHPSMPLGLFIDGLQAIDPDSLLLDTNAMVGESNFSALVAPPPDEGAPDLFTAMGSPMAVHFHAVFYNDRPVTRVIDEQTYVAPTIQIFRNAWDAGVPSFANSVSLELRPDGAIDVEYFPCFPDFYPCTGQDTPMYPSMIGAFGLPSQSLFFIDESVGVDISDGGHAIRTYTKFMLDTGSQLTVVGNTVASRMGLNPSQPDFQVEVQGVDGQIVLAPGFYLDTLDIPAVGEWLSFTQVPVVLLNVASPEGGSLDGIIGMNLLEKYNFVVHGGGLLGGGAPGLDFERIAIYGDFDGDFDVDADDLLVFQACMSGPSIAVGDEDCLDLDDDGDGDVDQSDFGAFQLCFSGADIDGNPACHPLQ